MQVIACKSALIIIFFVAGGFRAGLFGESLMKRRILLAAAFVFSLGVAAQAECLLKSPVEFAPEKSETSTIQIVLEPQNRFCYIDFDHIAGLEIARSEVVTKPASGTFLHLSGKRFKYERAKGFVGTDAAVFKLCGKTATGEGCSTITLNVKGD